MSVMGSSCDHPRPTSPPLLSCDLNQTSTLSSLHRFVFSQSSFRCREVMMISWPSTAFISSRTICFIFSTTRSPSGKYAYTPAISLWMYPARIKSCAFFATSSFGADFRVFVKSSDWRISGSIITHFRVATTSFDLQRGLGILPFLCNSCLLYTSDAADDLLCVDLG